MSLSRSPAPAVQLGAVLTRPLASVSLRACTTAASAGRGFAELDFENLLVFNERAMNTAATVRLLDVEPGIGCFLSDGDRAAASGLAVPVRSVSRGTEDVESKLVQAGAFAAI